ncbi:MAG: Pr6Pr family membrane protein [Gaiellaceae bacterium]
MKARAWYSTIAILLPLALVVQIVIAVKASGSPPSHGVGLLAGGSLLTRLVRVFSFFTIQANVLSAIVSVQLARDPDRDGRLWRILRLTTLIGITITGIVYSTVLARIHEPKGWEQVSTNAVFHYIVPIMMVLGWLLFGPRPRITRSVVAWALIWPVLWMSYTLAHGAVSKWYPYPFVDVATHGYGRVLLNAVGIGVIFVLAGVLFAFGDRKLPTTSAPT